MGKSLTIWHYRYFTQIKYKHIFMSGNFLNNLKCIIYLLYIYVKIVKQALKSMACPPY